MSQISTILMNSICNFNHDICSHVYESRSTMDRHVIGCIYVSATLFEDDGDDDDDDDDDDADYDYAPAA
ncbi:hypothetical protein EJD97_023101 [Solanum chilense]|uniref:Uncharacterized protein n=1 Tax=Solanum chilense TaxID=4083 RepID=A0A6N2AV63_SOLCI|nr:hypothetical protein EJD97_023101 [Solanum chilense]